MKRHIRHYMTAAGRYCALLAVGLALVSCGSSDNQTAGIGGTGIVYGKITDFGSIFVNGVEYETDGSRFVVDGDASKMQSDLSVGMVVRLSVKTTDGVLSREATEVVYDDEIQGKITAISTAGGGVTQRTFEVFGQIVTIDAASTFFSDTTFSGLKNGDIVEVSGFRSSPTAITATYIEKKGEFTPGGDNEVELRGKIDKLSGNSFEIDGTVINVDPLKTEIDVPGGVLVNGLLVEVKGNLLADDSIDAVKIEQDDEGFGGEIDAFSLQGIISNYNSIADFEIDGLTVDASTAQISPPASLLGNGLEVEVQGYVLGDILIANQVEIED